MIPSFQLLMAGYFGLPEEQMYRSYVLESDAKAKWWTRLYVGQQFAVFLALMGFLFLISSFIRFGPVDGAPNQLTKVLMSFGGLMCFAIGISIPIAFRHFIGREREVSPQELQWTSCGLLEFHIQMMRQIALPFFGGFLGGGLVLSPLFVPALGDGLGQVLGSLAGVTIGVSIMIYLSIKQGTPKIPAHEPYDDEAPGPVI
jgi:hypothetical protein